MQLVLLLNYSLLFCLCVIRPLEISKSSSEEESNLPKNPYYQKYFETLTNKQYTSKRQQDTQSY